ncbi:hypothetical protein FGU65_03465 [Methanoculleus sp. FWC-SCC1]|uniref:Uncharacterized protein n=1 Tax=Methanoculleus frigidifontis TaxID=2584085 RepID=A0ABT8M7Q4_9EURY|nr:hypothetical protein [Methanoculleus sp. FWC-SCC1]MDN7023960.1 hypothetical protein [Methanoculleus sp. FWC-SCC1]
MFRTITDLFKRKPPAAEPLVLGLEAVPGWLGEQENSIQGELEETTAPVRQQITDALHDIREAVRALTSVSEASVAHPRLKSISRSALPEFLKSVGQAVEKEPAGETEAFYSTAADILKGCIKATRGQGKYLQAAFPEEMKEFRSGLKNLGTGVNRMTEAIAGSRARLDEVLKARDVHQKLVRGREEYAAACEDADAMNREIASGSDELRRVDEELGTLATGPHHAEAGKLDLRIDALSERQEEIAREYTTIRTNALHVLRKAEKVMEKNLDRTTAESIRQLENALSSRVPDADAEITGLLTRVVPAALDVVGRREVTLKNREEQHLFSDAKVLRSELVRVISLHREVSAELDAARAERASLAGYAEEQRLRERRETVQAQVAEATATRAADRERAAALHEADEALREDLAGRLGALAGSEAALQADDLPVCPPAEDCE